MPKKTSINDKCCLARLLVSTQNWMADTKKNLFFYFVCKIFWLSTITPTHQKKSVVVDTTDMLQPLLHFCW